jgi:PhnB protein
LSIRGGAGRLFIELRLPPPQGVTVLRAHPYLNFAGNTEEAFEFYRTVFGADRAALLRYRDFADNAMNVPEADLDRVAHVALPIAPGIMLMGTDAVGSYAEALRAGNNYYINLDAESADEADRVFNALADGGNVEMPLMETEWAEKYGMCADRFGVQWMVNYEGAKKFTNGHAG